MKTNARAIFSGIAAVWLATANSVAEPPVHPVSEDAARPLVTIEGHRDLAPAIKHFVSVLSGPVVLQDYNDSVQVWRRPICPLVGGLPQKDGQFVFDHLSATLTSLGIRLGKVGCRPNFFVIVTTQPAALLKAAWERNSRLFGEGIGATHFIGTPRPVRMWYNAELTGADGAGSQTPPALLNTSLQGVPSFYIRPVSPRTEFGVVRELASVIAVIDLTKVAGLDWKQVTDYVAMAGLTNIRLDADFRDAPTLLRLFSVPAAERPLSLSTWDRAFLHGVYDTDWRSRRQRIDIVKSMVGQVTQ